MTIPEFGEMVKNGKPPRVEHTFKKDGRAIDIDMKSYARYTIRL